MKTALIRFQILLIILVVFSPLLYIGYQRFTPELNLLKFDFNRKQNPISISPLHTEGLNILNSENKPVILRGINLISTNWGDKYTTWNPEAISIASRDWHANVVRTRLYQHEFETSPADFFLTLEEQIIEPARKNGMYVILHPWFTDNKSLPDKHGLAMWLSVAKRYGNDPHIIFDLLAEPRDVTFDELQATYLSLIPQVRSVSPDTLIMVTGLDWGRDINAWLDSPLEFQNIIYRANPYNRTAEFPGYFGKIALKYPVFLGEFGTEDKLSMSLVDVKNILNYASALNLGWTAWHFTDSGCPCLLSNEPSFTPSEYGALVKSYLSGAKQPFTLPTFNNDTSRLYVYSDFLESGFADYSWGITNQMGVTIKTTFHKSSGLFLNTSRRIDPKIYKSFHLKFDTEHPESVTLRFKSYDSQLSPIFELKNGDNNIALDNLGIQSISGIVLESTDNSPDSNPVSLDEIYFQK